tara:strand:+ start:399 stop:608 length:210 start_codon:yes stop_codon:yes gene_type:complete
MKKRVLTKIIDFIREEMMSTGSTAGKPGFSSKADAEGPTAGFDPMLGKRKKYIYLRGVRKNWKKKDESK